MPKLFLPLMALFAVLVLAAACSPVYQTDYRFSSPPTEQGKQCANNCLDKLDHCLASCRSTEAQCRNTKNLEAEVEYLRYVNRQQKDGKPVELGKHDFTNYGECSTGCEDQCNHQQRICHVNCGGQITETKYCTAFCD